MEQKWVKPEDYSKLKEKESKRVGVKVCKSGRLLQVEGKGKQAGWSRSELNRKITPSGREEESKRVGADVCKTARLLQI